MQRGDLVRNLLILVIVFIAIISIVNAATISYTYLDAGSSSLNGVKAVVYEKSSQTKIGSTYTASGNIININYPTDSSNYYTYHFKDDYVSYQKTIPSNGDLILYRANNCGANSFIELPSSGTIDQQITITATLNKKVTDIFGSFLIGGYPEFVPSGLNDYYTIDTKLKLYVNNILKDTKTFKITNNPNSNINTFTWTPTSAGTYDIKVSTEVIDTQCQSFESVQDSLVKQITITEPTITPTCYQDELCKPDCTEGDLDCTCSEQNGNLCTTTQTCSGTELDHIGTEICCSVTCTNLYQCNDGIDNDNDNKIDLDDPGCSSTTDNDETDPEECSQTTPKCPPNAKEKCLTGHPRCSCSALNGYICEENKICLETELITEDSGVCCSIPCVKEKIPCSPEGKIETCDPDELGCTMLRICEDSYWTECKKLDPTCTGGTDCEDGTIAGKCSLSNPGKLCINGELQLNAEVCSITILEICQPLWHCTDWTLHCDDGHMYCNQWTNKNNCETDQDPPDNKQDCDYITPYQYELQAPSLTTVGQSQPPEEGKATIIHSVLDKLGLNIPRDYSVRLGLEYPLVLLIIAIVVAAFVFYSFSHKHPPKKQKKTKKKLKTKPVKINDLMLSVIESLKGDEKRIIDRLVEAEGMTVEMLRKKLGISKTKIDIALTKLERRQILKEREDYEGPLYFNDWLK